MLLVGNAARIGRLAHDTYLLVRHTDKTVDDYTHNRLFHVIRIGNLDVTRQLGGCLATRFKIFYQAGRHLAVGTNNNGGGELFVTPDKNLHGVAGPDQVGVVLAGEALVGGHFRQRGTASRNYQRHEQHRN